MVEATTPSSGRGKAGSGEAAETVKTPTSSSVSVVNMVKPGQQHQPRTLNSLIKAHIIHVALTLYESQLDGKLLVNVLREQLQQLMEAVLSCDNVACGGGPCNPGVHVFTPAQYLPGGEGGDDFERLLQTSQQDIDVTTPAGSPAQQDPLPRRDGAEQQKQLALDALHRAGFSAQDIWPEGATPGAGSAPRQGGGSTFRNLLNSFSRSSSSTPRPNGPQPRLSTQAVRMPPPGTASNTLGVHPRPPQPGVQQQAPPVATGDNSSTVDALMELVRLQQEQSAAQTKSHEALADRLAQLLERKVGGADGTADSQAGPSKGKVVLAPPNNPSALALAGVTIGPKWVMSGDLSSVDMKHVKKYIKSGRSGQSVQDARTAELWPNAYLPARPGSKDGIDYDDLTFTQWVVGFVTKIFSEIEDTRNGSPEHHQLRMLMKLCRLVQVYPWEEVRLIGAELFLGLERGALSWQEWQPMEIWWAQQIDFLRDRVVSKQGVKRSAPTAPAGPSTASNPPGQPPAKVQKKNKLICGVPPDTLKASHICIKWNVGTCQVQASRHDSPDKSDSQQVRHICGGCWFLGKVEDESHSMKTCKKKNAQGLFQ